MKEIFYLSCYTPVSIDKWFGRIHLNAEMKNLILRIYHQIGKLEGICELLDKVFVTEYNFIKEKHCYLNKSLDVLDKAKNIPNHMKERMKCGLAMMYQKPFFRIEELRSECDVTHSTATKMVNLFIALKLVKQVNDKQRYRVYEYIPLIECIQRI